MDAVIVNDLGVLRDIRRKLPEMAITVSIGCGALNVDDVLFYQDLGASAVVLPGYLEPREIAAIKAKSSSRRRTDAAHGGGVHPVGQVLDAKLLPFRRGGADTTGAAPGR